MTDYELVEEEGAEALRAGLPLSACPYRGEAAMWWEDGWWAEAKRLNRKRRSPDAPSDP